MGRRLNASLLFGFWLTLFLTLRTGTVKELAPRLREPFPQPECRFTQPRAYAFDHLQMNRPGWRIIPPRRGPLRHRVRRTEFPRRLRSLHERHERLRSALRQRRRQPRGLGRPHGNPHHIPG